MNWKKWDENTWVNMDNGHILEINSFQGNCQERKYYVCYDQANEIQTTFKTYTEAVAFIEELIK